MHFVKESIIRASPERVFAFHELPDALDRLLPPWETARVVLPPKNLHAGTRTIVETKLFGFYKVRWEALHTAYDPPRMFEDVQVKGPFKSWRHRHIVEPHELGARLLDDIEYEPPFSIFGRLAAPLLVERRLKRLFDYRHEVTRRWAEASESI
ncbi:MAG: SRPBCC family protein [Pyrinomonadaceae bacterium]|nr:SRPBCC family protein [Pyrinomonadaceae bacterium]